MSHSRIYGCLIALATSLGPIMSAVVAESPRAWAIQILNQQDLDTLHPLISMLLEDDAVGTSHPWQSLSGKSGFVFLDAGGDQAGSNEATVRITRTVHDKEVPLCTFRYRKGQATGWVMVG
jgi:hypothetical protein